MVYKKTLTFDSLMGFAVFLYTFSIVFFDGSIVFKVFTTFLFTVGTFYIFSRRKIELNGFVVMLFMFLCLNIALVTVGQVYSGEITQNRLSTLSLSYLASFMILTYLIQKNNRKQFIKMYLSVVCLFSAYVVIKDFNNLFHVRFAAAVTPPFGLLITTGRTYNSNTISLLFGFAIMLCVIQYFSISEGIENHKKRKMRYFTLACAFGFISILTGSRKVILQLAFFLILLSLLTSQNQSKRFRNLLIAVVVIIMTYIMLTTIPSLYSFAGQRLESILQSFFTRSAYKEGSAYYRNEMILIGLALIKERPWLGWGLDSFFLLSPYHTYSHNNYIEILTSSGIIGATIYYGALLMLLLKLKKGYNKSHLLDYKVGIAYILASLCSEVGQVTYLQRSHILLLFFLSSYSEVPCKSFQTRHDSDLKRIVKTK